MTVPVDDQAAEVAAAFEAGRVLAREQLAVKLETRGKEASA